MKTQNVIVYKVIRRTSKIGKHVWCDTNVGLIKKPITDVPSIAMKAFEAREQEEYWNKERLIPNCRCQHQVLGRKVFVGEAEGRYYKCMTCGGKIWN